MGSSNPTDWKECCPGFVLPEDWSGILESWMTETWMKRSKAGADNRKKVPGDETGTCSYVRHTGGSISFDLHSLKMVTETGKPPSELELFEKVHKRQKGQGEWCDSRAEQVSTKYQETIKEKHLSESENANDVDLPSDIPFDPQAWVKATGIARKKEVYGFGLTKEAENILSQVSSHSAKKPSTCTSSQVNNEEEINARVQEQIEPLKLQIEQMKKMIETLQRTMPSQE